MVGMSVKRRTRHGQKYVRYRMGAAVRMLPWKTAYCIMADKLANLPFAIGLVEKHGQIIKQNLVIS